MPTWWAIRQFAKNVGLRRKDDAVVGETDNPFEKVLDRLREKGWMKGRFGGGDGPNCLLGAKIVVSPNEGYSELELTIREHYPDRRLSCRGIVSGFNDHPATTFADVERVLEKAAVKWEEERVLRND